MTSKLIPRGTRTTFCVLLLIVVCVHARGTRVGHEGDDWLQWSKKERLIYVSGYIAGAVNAYGRGCRVADEINPQQSFKDTEVSTFGRCLEQGPSFKRGAEHYAAQVTMFYEQYPNDRPVYIREIVDLSADNKNKTLEEIDQLYRSKQLK